MKIVKFERSYCSVRFADDVGEAWVDHLAGDLVDGCDVSDGCVDGREDRAVESDDRMLNLMTAR